MRKLLMAAMLLVALFSTSFSSAQSVSASPLADLSGDALTAHNAFRQQIAAEESQRLGGTVSIPDLTWNSDLAVYAQAWADQLLSFDPDPNNPSFPHHDWNELGALGRGESIYASWAEGDAILYDSAQTAVNSWASERPYYNYDTNSCAAGQVCGHYTQLVWAATTQVGCGQATRTTPYGRRYVVWVCNYAPGGNMTINGQLQRPYSVTPGTPGANCTTYNWTRDLYLGLSGEDVVALQMWLAAANQTVYQTGLFDDTTYHAVRHFQGERHLVVDGIVGPQTQGALNLVCPKFKRLGRRH